VTLFPLERLQKLAGRGVPVVAIACGAAKAPAILAAWRGKFFNCLVTDLACAERIASEKGRAKGETVAKR
jgi:DNA-binding transcriptional regulator LsrR (DeoR family)